MTTSRKSALVSTVAMFLGIMALSLPGFAQSYSAAGNFSESSNPNGTWSYGYSYGLGSTFILDTSNTTAYAGLALSGWLGNVESAPGAGYPYALQNQTAHLVTNNIHTVYQPGQLGLVPGITNEDSVVRWTAPFSGTFTINATFSGLSSLGDSADVHVLLNGIALFNANVIPTATYSVSTNLIAGNTLDFVVGNGGNGGNEDTTALSATIVPEPGTVGLVAVGFACLFSFRFLKRK